MKLVDAKLHDDAIHRGPAQVIPAARNAIYGAITISEPTLLEPMQKVFISTLQEIMGDASRELNSRRAEVKDMKTVGDSVEIEAKAPVAEMFGFVLPFNYKQLADLTVRHRLGYRYPGTNQSCRKDSDNDEAIQYP